ncbi:ATP-binding protein [uncultured Spirosoma sp.]|uniref:AAA family ATPase n=1 Tax=uncultured Spirosoma sp. TaxID=278208 RepID=UPI0025856FA6|nr:ATP-binding protein [uncultured Spirosoma sp.]
MLKRVSIQNFKSLKDVTLDLRKVNLLIGPNNSGKTNFLKAIDFISSWSNGQILDKFDARALAFKHSDHQHSEIEVLAESTNSEQTYSYNLKTRGSQISNSEDEFIETLKKIARDGTILDNSSLNYHPYLGGIVDGQQISPGQYKPGHFIKLHNDTYTASAQVISKILEGVRIYKPDPNKLDKPSPVGRGDSTVAADASNLIAFFDRIRDEYSATFAQIKADLAKCVPEFTEINFQNVESTDELVKQFGDKTFKRIGLTDGRQNTIYWADELSEGTLYFIALLCIINQPNPPKLLLLEEPEKGIHPRRIFEVIQFIFRLAEEKDVQVIMTTHSPIVVDMFKDMPESVFIFDKDDEGATHVKNLQRDVIEPEAEKSRELGIEPHHYTDSLGDAWTVGFLGGVPK